MWIWQRLLGPPGEQALQGWGSYKEQTKKQPLGPDMDPRLPWQVLYTLRGI